MDLHILFRLHPISVHSIQEIQKSISSTVKAHLMFIHAITVCDMVSALHNMEKNKELTIFDRGVEDVRGKRGVLNPFSQPGSTHVEVACISELFLRKLYGAVWCTSLDKRCNIRYMRRVSTTSVSSCEFQLESLPLTSATVKYQSHREYSTVQQWLGNELSPTE